MRKEKQTEQEKIKVCFEKLIGEGELKEVSRHTGKGKLFAIYSAGVNLGKKISKKGGKDAGKN